MVIDSYGGGTGNQSSDYFMCGQKKRENIWPQTLVTV